MSLGGAWTLVTPAAVPSARAYSAAAYHAGSSGTILFGGYDGSTPRLNDTQLWNGTTWAAQAPSTVPTARDGHAIAVDPGNDLYMFGGEDAGGLLSQLYSWDGADWTLESPATTTPAARRDAGLAQAPGSDVVWMHGGKLAAGGEDAVWKWDGSDWSSHTPAFVPPRRYRHAMWYDAARDGVVIAYGLDPSTEQALDDVWFYDGITWTEITPTERPSARAPGSGAAFDSAKARALIAAHGLPATGSITTPIGFEYTDGETFTLDDGVNAAKVFELDDDASVGGGNVAVDITGDGLGDAEVMRDRIVAAINGASSLDINAYAHPTETDVVLLQNNVAGAHGIVAIVDTVATSEFETTGMGDSLPDTWMLDSKGAVFADVTPSASVPPIADGAVMFYDGTSKLILFGGRISTTYLSTHHEWAWNEAGLSPYWSYPGVIQGRVQPKVFPKSDGTYLYVLGADLEDLPEYLLDIGDEITLVQDITLSGTRLIRADIRMRYSPRMPRFRTVLSAGRATFKTTGLVASGDGLDGVEITDPLFTKDDEDQLLSITGATTGGNNVTSERISSVPSGQGDFDYFDAGSQTGLGKRAGRAAVIEATMAAYTDDPAVTIKRLGAQWRAQILIDTGGGDVVRAEWVESLVQARPDGWQRANLAANVSKIVGSATLTFKLALEQVTA